MAQYDVYANPDGSGYLLDVQSDLISVLNVRTVVPLILRDGGPIGAGRLNPKFSIAGTDVVMMTEYIAAVPASLLKRRADNLESQSDRITGALDMLLHGI